MTEAPKPKQPPSLLKTFIAGGAGGASLVLVGHPLDTVKVRIQTMEIKPGQAPPYSGTLDCIQKTIRREGFFGLYRGMSAPLYGVTPMYALCFYGYGIGQKIFLKEDSLQNLTTENLCRIGLAGATSGLFTTPILAPLERIKCELQVQGQRQEPGKPPKYAGTLDCAKKLYATSGLAGVNRGFFATMLRDSLASAFYFSSYEFFKRQFTRQGEKGPNVAGVLVAGGLAGIFNWLACLPVDTLKSKLQIAPEGKYPNGIRSVFAEVVKTDGFMALYRGFGPVMIRAFPANAACFFGYESAIKALDYFGIQ
eukprot:TRINITY_DN4374_c0_g1_i2.p1 TRINITY_DN4374_c0_g1~~TRINITY_DN4374_c0_g1_i2.p1  ORF type:complete len:322 (+),score=58.93 TRINITY_DN4374_c0_g1_i2:42-968(+)